VWVIIGEWFLLQLSWALFDHGTNYCNMRNLLEGAGLTQLPGGHFFFNPVALSRDRQLTKYTTHTFKVVGNEK
jgi:hypothetical protein